jgi:cob(I)alamin adenosyltransferase
MKIYTKKGDKGSTGLLGGTRVPKHHVRIESYGTTDELNSQIGLLISLDESNWFNDELLVIQDRLFTIGSHLAADPVKNKFELPVISNIDVEYLEKKIDKMQEILTELKSFILPGGSVFNAQCHIARCVCRRAERCVSHLSEVDKVEAIILQYLNRLSDYLFVLSRMINFNLEKPETVWIPK